MASKSSRKAPTLDALELHMVASQRRDKLIEEARELLDLGNTRGARRLLTHAEKLDEQLRALQAGFALPWSPDGSRAH